MSLLNPTSSAEACAVWGAQNWALWFKPISLYGSLMPSSPCGIFSSTVELQLPLWNIVMLLWFCCDACGSFWSLTSLCVAPSVFWSLSWPQMFLLAFLESPSVPVELICLWEVPTVLVRFFRPLLVSLESHLSLWRSPVPVRLYRSWGSLCSFWGSRLDSVAHSYWFI